MRLVTAVLLLIGITVVFAQKNRCCLPPVKGPCKASITRWHYDCRSGNCKEFIYGGCGGNGNNFEDKHACRTACNKPKCCGH